MAKANNKPQIDNAIFQAAIKSVPVAPTQKTVVVTEKIIEKKEEISYQSMYFKIDKRLKKDLTVYLAQQDLYIQNYLHDLIMNDLREKNALNSF